MWQVIGWIMIAFGLVLGAFILILLPLNTLKTYWKVSSLLERVIGSVSVVILPIGFWLLSANSESVDFSGSFEGSHVLSLIGAILAVAGFAGIAFYYPKRGEKHLNDRCRQDERAEEN